MKSSKKMALAMIAGFAVVATALPAAAQQTRYYDFSGQRWIDGAPSDRAQMRETQRAQARSSNTMPRPDARFDRREVSVSTNERPGTIIVDTANKFLYYVEGNGKATRYGVGVGREGFGWAGTATVGRKAEWPGWTPPAAMRERERRQGRILPAFMPGGPENPLGARALYLYQGGRDTLYRIHGTNQPWSIGQNLSSGCIRMMNEDVVELHDRTRNGAKVIVVGAGQDAGRYITETGLFRSASAEDGRSPFGRFFGQRTQ